MSSNKIYQLDNDIDRNENKINVNLHTHPSLHVGEEVLELGEPDLGRGHKLPHDGKVAIARAEGLAAVELHLPAALLHPGPQLTHVLLQLLHAEIRGSFVTFHHFVTFGALLQIVTNVSGQYKSMRDSCQRDRPSVTHKKHNPASFFPFVGILCFEKNVFFFNILDFGSVLDVWEIGFKEKTFSELK